MIIYKTRQYETEKEERLEIGVMDESPEIMKNALSKCRTISDIVAF